MSLLVSSKPGGLGWLVGASLAILAPFACTPGARDYAPTDMGGADGTMDGSGATPASVGGNPSGGNGESGGNGPTGGDGPTGGSGPDSGGGGPTGGNGNSGGSGGGSNTGPCEDHDCENGSACFPDGDDAYTCDCTNTGFEGEFCETEINECEPNPCEQSAACEDLINDYDCDCPDEYAGKNCDLLTFEFLDLPLLSVAHMSPDGTVLVGSENSVAVIYQDGELNELGIYPGDTRSAAYAASTGGEVVVGRSEDTDAGTSRAVVWEDATIVELEAPPGSPNCVADSVTSDGQIIAGSCGDENSDNRRVVRWVDRQVEEIASPGGVSECFEGQVSSDGQVVYGNCSIDSNTQVMRWTAVGGSSLLSSSVPTCRVRTATADGSISVGTCTEGGSNSSGFAWTEGEGFEFLTGDTYTEADDVSGDGEFIVGRMGNLGDGIFAVLWDGMRTPIWIEDVIAAEGITPTGWTTFTDAAEISADGNTIFGYGDLGKWILRRN